MLLLSGFVFVLISNFYLTSSCMSQNSDNPNQSCQSCNQTNYLNNISPKVQVEVYYETLCSDTRTFIQRQLYPVWQQLGHENIMEIKWKPYGKARHWEHEGQFKFYCHFGPEECIGNKIHACSIKYISNQHKLADYIHCMIRYNGQLTQRAEQCSQTHQVPWDDIYNCLKKPFKLVLVF